MLLFNDECQSCCNHPSGVVARVDDGKQEQCFLQNDCVFLLINASQ